MSMTIPANREPRSMVRHGRTFGGVASLCVVVGVLSACGGSSESGGGSGAAAVGKGGTKILTASGKEITTSAYDHYTDGVKAFEQAEQAGWPDASCSNVLSLFEDADAAMKNFAEAIFMQGLVKDKCGDNKAALNLYNKALRANSKLCKARVGIGLDQVKRGGAGARSTFERSIRDDPQCTEGYVNLAIVQRKSGENAEALNNLRRALAIDAQYLPAFNEMALLYLNEAADNKKKLDLAEVVCSQAQKIDASYPAVYNTWGLIDLRRKKIIEASAKFQKAFELDPKMFEAYMNFAQITIGFRGYQDAKVAFQKALELRPSSFDAQVGLGVALRGLSDNEGAIAAYEKAIKLQPNRPEPYYNLGVLWQDFQGGAEADMKKAERYYDQFLSRARGNRRFEAAVDDVTRKCKEKRRRRASTKCIAGRLQNIDNYRRALKEMAEMEKLQAEAERQAAELEAQEKAQAEKAAQEATQPGEPAQDGSASPSGDAQGGASSGQ